MDGRRALGIAFLRGHARGLLNTAIAVWIFTGGLVLVEPSPYELMFVLVLPLALLAGINVFRSTLPLLAIVIGFIPFALIGAFQSSYDTTQDALTFAAITIFMLVTSYFLANFTADNTIVRMRLIIAAYTTAAVLVSLVGILAYLGLLPGRELFLLYGRAKATFKDPNVFGPFLILPAAYALQRALLLRGWPSLLAGGIFMVLFVGVFVSFSRAAWGHLGLTALLVLVLCFWLEAKAHDKVRILILSMVGLFGMLLALGGLASIPAVGSLLATRLQSQTYDSGESGRFGRQGYAFELALEHPLGIGPAEFAHLRVTEAPHNSYVNALHVYGWGGGALYCMLVVTTLWRGFAALRHPSPYRLLMIPLISTFIMLAGEAAIIDTDHWRHYFLIVGLIWGVASAIDNGPKVSGPREASLV